MIQHPTRSTMRPHRIACLAALVALSLLAVACDEPEPTSTAGLGPTCTPTERGGETYCVGRYWITETGFACAPDDPLGCDAITETGFSCPPDSPVMVRQGGHFVCAPTGAADMTPEERNEIITATDPDGSCLTVVEPAVDHDHDDLASGIEDRNRNCIQDSGETDWRNIDTDGDLLADGHEDHNLNGVFEPWRGETNPLLVDSDGDGIVDAAEWGAAWCHPYQLDTGRRWGQLLGRASVALPRGFVVHRHPSGRGGVFGDPNLGVFGFVAEPVGAASSVEDRADAQLAALSALGHVPLREQVSAPFAAFSIERYDGVVLLPERPAIGSRALLAYGPESPNPTQTAADPALVRDQIFGALLGDPGFSSGFAALSSCDRIEAAWLETTHPDDDAPITAAVLACRDTVDDSDAAAGLLLDLQAATLIAPSHQGQVFDVLEMRCEEQAVPDTVGQLDVLWVIDNSHSMHGEQVAVSDSATQFIDTLDRADVDWRIGVTTTEAWARDRTDFYRVGVDPWTDPATGLRGGGFLGPADARADFAQLVTEWPGCQRDPGDPVGQNICGLGFESGLASGRAVLADVKADARPAYQLRDEAVPLVVWVSDEEDLAFKDGPLDPPWTRDDARRALATQQYAAQYSAFGAVGCAIVGDDQANDVGACAPDTSASGGESAVEHGRGYIDLAAASGGVSGSLCQPDLSATIDACLQRAIARTAAYPLQRTPVAGNMRVLIDGREIPRSATSGWSYDPATNALTFADTALPPAAQVQTVFNTWAPLPR